MTDILPPAPVSTVQDAAIRTSEPPPAGFWIRVAAYLLDGLFLFIANMVLMIPLFTLLGGETIPYHDAPSGSVTPYDEGNSTAETVIGMVAWLGAILYYTLFTASSWQATPGKWIVGVHVINRRGERLSLLHSLGRWAAEIFSGLTLGLGHCLAGWTKRKTALHDMIAGTYVVYGRPETPPFKTFADNG